MLPILVIRTHTYVAGLHGTCSGHVSISVLQSASTSGSANPASSARALEGAHTRRNCHDPAVCNAGWSSTRFSIARRRKGFWPPADMSAFVATWLAEAVTCAFVLCKLEGIRFAKLAGAHNDARNHTDGMLADHLIPDARLAKFPNSRIMTMVLHGESITDQASPRTPTQRTFQPQEAVQPQRNPTKLQHTPSQNTQLSYT